MSDNNLPGEPGPVDDSPSFDQSVEDIANLLPDDPETDPVDGDEEVAKAEAADDGDDPEIDVSEDVEDEDAAEDADGSEAEIKGGRFAPDTAKVTLDDGTVTTIAELKRGSMFQRDYTKKTTELSDQRKQVEAKASEVDQQAQSLALLSERLTEFSKSYLPQPPGAPPDDPQDFVGWHNYRLAKDQYDQALQQFYAIDQERTTLTQKQQQDAEKQAQADFAAEMQKLEKTDAFFADNAKAKAFLEEVTTKGADWWGLDPADLQTLRTAKQWLILRDALRYRKALAKGPEVKQQVQAKPIARSGKRVDPKARVSSERQARSERLRRSGSIEDGIAAIADLI